MMQTKLEIQMSLTQYSDLLKGLTTKTQSSFQVIRDLIGITIN